MYLVLHHRLAHLRHELEVIAWAPLILPSLSTFLEDNEQGETNDSEMKDRTLFQTLTTRKNKFDTRGRRIAHLSVEQHVEDLIIAADASDSPLVEQYTIRTKENVDRPEGTPVDMRAELVKFLPELKSTPLNAKNEVSQGKNPLWSDDDKRPCKKAYRFRKDGVVARAGVHIGTAYTAANRDFAHFGEEPATSKAESPKAI